jgi:chromosome partitioning protein
LKVIAILARKGGVGKGLLARSIAVSGLIHGMKTAICDTDPQGSCLAWGKRREEPAPTIEGMDQPLGAKLALLKKLGADLVLIDTPPSIQPAINLAAANADLCLIVSGVGPEDVEAVGATADIVRSLKKPSAIILNRCPSRAQSVSMARAALTTFHLPVCPVALTQLVAHQYASADGLTASELEPNGKAARELEALWKWISAQGWLAEAAVTQRKRAGG